MRNNGTIGTKTTMDSVDSIFIASDHNGNAARAYVLKVLEREGFKNVVDFGPFEKDGKVDYPSYAEIVTTALKNSVGYDRGILICGTGTGMCIAANRFPWIRAGLATDRATAELMREHNDCNVLVLGQWRSSLSQMDEIVRSFLTTPYGGGRHDRRLKLLAELTP